MELLPFRSKMYKKNLSKGIDEIEDICDDIIEYTKKDKDESSLIRTAIYSARKAFLESSPRRVFFSVTPLYENLRHWHNIPKPLLKKLDQETYYLGATAIRGIIRQNLSLKCNELICWISPVEEAMDEIMRRIKDDKSQK